MTQNTYDIITVGGGLAGAVLALVMAKHGAKVLVLERETQFKDRVRGEQVTCWGVGEARELGIYDILQHSGCGQEVRWWQTIVGGAAFERRDCLATTPQQAPQFVFYHPTMQEVLLAVAVEAGAEVRRDATVRDVRSGAIPTVIVERQGRTDELSARLVVGADGRTSLVRKWAGFMVQQDRPQRLLAGVLFDEMASLPTDTIHWIVNPQIGQAALIAPQGHGRVRAYVVYPHTASHRLQGAGDIPRFIAASVEAGTPSEFFTGARGAGPLASFDGADTWVPHPYRAGVVLIGDAASSNDPCFGQGLSLTLRDVRTLRDQLTTQENWETAGHAYAEAHDRYYDTLHRVTEWLGQMLYEPGPAADARRERALPLIGQDGRRVPDHLFSGLDLPADETVRRRFFGEE